MNNIHTFSILSKLSLSVSMTFIICFNDAPQNGFIFNYIIYPYVSLLICILQTEIEMVGIKAKVATDAT